MLQSPEPVTQAEGAASGMRQLTGVNLRHLQTFVAIARHGVMKEAAEHLCCSLSTVSATQAALERSVGSVLLVRTARGWVPTVAGAKALIAAEAVLAAAAAFLVATQGFGDTGL